MIVWPKELVNDIARRKTVLVLGAGVSKNSTNANGERPKDWKAFLIDASVALRGKAEIKKQIRNGDYLTACELIKKELGREQFNNLVRSEFLTPGFVSADIHETIYNLDSRIVVTPNFDKIYETYAAHTSNGSIAVKKFTDTDLADCIRRPEPIIIKIHGSADAADSLIFTRKDYSEARTKHQNFYRIIEALYLTHTFVFIGCGTSDPDTRLILEDYTFKYPLNRQHYMISSKGMNNKVREIIEETMSLKILEYDGSGNHKILTDSLKALCEKVELKRIEIAALQSW